MLAAMMNPFHADSHSSSSSQHQQQHYDQHHPYNSQYNQHYQSQQPQPPLFFSTQPQQQQPVQMPFISSDSSFNTSQQQQQQEQTIIPPAAEEETHQSTTNNEDLDDADSDDDSSEDDEGSMSLSADGTTNTTTTDASAGPGLNAKGKKRRIRATKPQVAIMDAVFKVSPNPDSATRKRMAEQCGMSERSVQIWFQNRRARTRFAEKMGLPPPGTPKVKGKKKYKKRNRVDSNATSSTTATTVSTTTTSTAAENITSPTTDNNIDKRQPSITTSTATAPTSSPIATTTFSNEIENIITTTTAGGLPTLSMNMIHPITTTAAALSAMLTPTPTNTINPITFDMSIPYTPQTMTPSSHYFTAQHHQQPISPIGMVPPVPQSQPMMRPSTLLSSSSQQSHGNRIPVDTLNWGSWRRTLTSGYDDLIFNADLLLRVFHITIENAGQRFRIDVPFDCVWKIESSSNNSTKDGNGLVTPSNSTTSSPSFSTSQSTSNNNPSFFQSPPSTPNNMIPTSTIHSQSSTVTIYINTPPRFYMDISNDPTSLLQMGISPHSPNMGAGPIWSQVTDFTEAAQASIVRCFVVGCSGVSGMGLGRELAGSLMGVVGCDIGLVNAWNLGVQQQQQQAHQQGQAGQFGGRSAGGFM
ncbi:hypothetical protein HDU76_004809 [Blyttiomyces sp. JEL0837]|nr:hypothetical protein HDU76_004809 [Blyttiomyces sp. JEL0837]